MRQFTSASRHATAGAMHGRQRRRWTRAKTRRVVKTVGNAIYAAFVGLTLTFAIIGIFLIAALLR